MEACDLADNKCIPCRGGVPALTPEQIAPLFAQLDEGWDIQEDKKLVKSYKVHKFTGAMEFANRIAVVAEEEGHHPDLLVRYGSVSVTLWTHKIDGLTESDFFMAAKIDRVFESLNHG